MPDMTSLLPEPDYKLVIFALPPTDNHLRDSRGRSYKKRKAVLEWAGRIAGAMEHPAPLGAEPVPKAKAKRTIQLLYWFATAHYRDETNYRKTVEDAMTAREGAGLLVDDRPEYSDLFVWIGKDADNPRTEVLVWEGGFLELVQAARGENLTAGQ